MSLKLNLTSPARLGKPLSATYMYFTLLLLFNFRPYFKRDEQDEFSVLVIIQCDSGHSNGDLIACARNRIYDVRSEKEGDTHVVFVIHLPHQAASSSFVGFQGDPWISVHIDDLRPTSDGTIIPYEAMDTAISQLFLGSIVPEDQFGAPMDQGETATNLDDEEGDVEMDSRLHRPSTREGNAHSEQMPPLEGGDEGESMDEDAVPHNEEEENSDKMSTGSAGREDSEEETMEGEGPMAAAGMLGTGDEQPTLPPPQCRRLHGCIQAAASKLQDDNKRRATQRVEILVNLIPKDIPLPLGKLLVVAGATTKTTTKDYCLYLSVSNCRSTRVSRDPCSACLQCSETERPGLGTGQAVGP